MKKEYQSPVMEVTELETKEMVLQASDGCPGVSDSPSDTGMGSEANKNIFGTAFGDGYQHKSFHIMLVRFRMRSALGSDSRRTFFPFMG